MIRARRWGFTLVEVLVVMAIVGILVRVTAIKLRPSVRSRVEEAGMQLLQDVDLARTRALSTGAMVRVNFTAGSRRYDAFLDHDRDGAFALTNEERLALQGTSARLLPAGVTFGRGVAPVVPGDGFGGATPRTPLFITGMGMSVLSVLGTTSSAPLQVTYLRSVTDPQAVVAVGVYPSGGLRLWRFLGGAWR